MCCKGQALIQTLGLVFIMMLTGAFAVDTGLYFAIHKGMQNAADASALAGAAEFFRYAPTDLDGRMASARASAQSLSEENMGNILNDDDIEFGFVDPTTGAYDPDAFPAPTADPDFAATGGYNAVRTVVRAATGEANNPIPAIFSQYLGFTNFDSQAEAVAIYGGSVNSAGGLRPVYMCQAAWDKAVQLYGDPTVPQITFYGSTLTVGSTSVDAASSCGSLGPGNWGLADLDNSPGAPGAATVGDWFENGYDDQVVVGETYESQPGNSIHSYSSEINNLITSQTVITVPLYDSTSGSGSGATYDVSSIAAFVITELKSTGPSSGRYIKGYFRKKICQDCTLGNAPGGSLTKLRLVQ